MGSPRRKKLIRNQKFSYRSILYRCSMLSITDYSVARYVALFRLHEDVHLFE